MVFNKLIIIVCRANCKFIHCTREEEELYKLTGELPPGVHDPDASSRYNRSKNGVGVGGGGGGLPDQGGMRQMKNNRPNMVMMMRNGAGCVDYSDIVQEEIPLCKDFQKGICDRPPGGDY
jgi:hypothetical protein